MNGLTFVTGNKRKALEAEKILGIPLIVVSVDLEEIQDTQLEKVALHKLKQAYELTKKPVIIDDVGLYIEEWNGFPGPLIKWILKAGNGNASMLLKMMQGLSNRAARAQLLIGLHDGEQVQLFSGEVTGTIAESMRGENGFGWDSVFIPDGFSKTYAEMTLDEKSKISHRKKALDKLRTHIRNQEQKSV